MEWSNEEILEFIGLYENHPVLWNPKHPGHKNRNALNDAWQNIAREISIEVSVEVLRKKKESLMATYRTLAKKVRDSEITGSGANEVYVPSWFAYEAIDRFIRATGKKIPSLTSQILSMLHEQQSTSGDHKEVLKNALQTADMSLLLGAPLSAPYDCSMMKVAQILTEAFSEMCSTVEINVPTSSVKHQMSENNRAISVKTALESIPGIRGKPLQCLEKPSLEKFHKEFFQKRYPVKLKGCISHWPALERWKDIDYLRRVAGARTVPIELGAHYVDPDWSQKLMTFSDFLDRHVTSSEPGIPVGYLAQHPLFDQVPILKSDIYEPEYCCLSDSVDNEAESIDVNAWFGPRGTVSPLHHDPKHNLLSQVVGEKRIILYRPEESELLYPHDTTMLGNTARVDPESPDYSQFPRFRDANAFECHLEPGDMVYIPPKWWHHVRSLLTSFSVSFWWI